MLSQYRLSSLYIIKYTFSYHVREIITRIIQRQLYLPLRTDDTCENFHFILFFDQYGCKGLTLVVFDNPTRSFLRPRLVREVVSESYESERKNSMIYIASMAEKS